MPFGNVNVKYQPCKSEGQLKSAVNYMLGIQPEQIRSGIIKTQDHLYSALGCNRDNFANSILVTRKLNGRSYSRIKENNIIAHKLSISFHHEDNEKLTYELAYKIAEEFANEFMYSKGYEVLFAVHTDTDHTHVHFVVSNCNVDTGKSYRRNKKMLYDMSVYFGKQCLEHGLTHSVRDEFYNQDLDRSRDNLTYAEYQMRKKGKESFKDELREVIQVEIADKANKTFDDVMAALWRHYNVETRVKGNTVSYRHPEYKDKNGNLVSVRGSKLGALYTRKGIEYELTKKLTRQYEQSAEAERSGEITDTAGENRHPYGNIGKPVAEATDLARGQLDRSGKQATANGISDNSRGNVQSSDDFYERYRKRHQKSKGRTNEAVKPAKEYIKTSGNEIDKLVYRTYDDVKEKYAVLIEKALKEATDNHNRSMKALERVADKCTETAKKAQENNAMLCRVDNFWKFLNFTAPIYVIADIVIRLIFR